MQFLAQEAQPVPQQPAAQPGQGATPPAGGCGGDPSMFILIAIIWAVLYFVMIRPQNKAEKERKAKLSAIAKGDVVRTRGGIIATVARVKDTEVILRIDGDAKVELVVAKSYVDEVLPRGEPETKA
jgi:preprotein translocase subunit YajC